MTSHCMTESAPIDSSSPKYWSQRLQRIATHRDESTFEELHDHFAPLIRGFFMSNPGTSDKETAEELIQEVMMKVWFKSNSYDPKKAAASTWIFTLARNVRIDYLRKAIRHDSKTESLETNEIWDEGTDNQPYVYLHQARDQKQMDTLLKELPLEQSECLQKVYIEGKSHSEISNELRLPLGTVKSRVRLGLKRLTNKLDPDGGGRP